MRKCPFCQAENRDSAVFCTRCGKKMDEPIAEPYKKSENRVKKKPLVFGVCFLLIAVLAGSLLYFSKAPRESTQRA